MLLPRKKLEIAAQELEGIVIARNTMGQPLVELHSLPTRVCSRNDQCGEINFMSGAECTRVPVFEHRRLATPKLEFLSHMLHCGIGICDQHSFALTKETPALFEAQTSGQVQWSLDGPGGQVLSAPSNASGPSANSATPVDLVAGTYTLSIQGVGNATGSYQFHLLDLTAAAGNPSATPLPDALTRRMLHR